MSIEANPTSVWAKPRPVVRAAQDRLNIVRNQMLNIQKQIDI